MKNAKKALSLILTLFLVIAAIPTSIFSTAVDLSDTYRLTVSGSYVYNLPEKTTVADLMSGVYSTAVLKTAEGTALDRASTAYVVTGMLLCYTAAEYTVIIAGDLNCDGEVTAADYLLERKCVTKAVTLTGAALAAADVDGDGTATTADMLVMKKHISKKIDMYSNCYLTDDEKAAAVVGDPTVSDESTDSSDPSNDIDNYGTIHFEGDTVTVTGTGVTAVDNYAYVTAAGEFTVTGQSDNGYIHVMAATTDKVAFNLSGVKLTNTSGAALFCEQSKKIYLKLADGTENVFADGTATTLTDKGAIFSNDTIEISGGGSLTVTGNRQHGIVCDDDIIVNSGTVTVSNAVKDAFHANDDITVNGGTVTVSAAGSDALESEATLNVTGGILNLSSTLGNALKATTVLSVTGGQVNVLASDNAIKGDAEVNISGGTLDLNCTNNAIKSDLLVNISGGDISVNSTGDGIKSYSQDLTATTGEVRTSYTYTALNGSVSSSGAYVWTTGSVSNTAYYWFAAVAESNGTGGYTVTAVYPYGQYKTFTVPTGGIALLTYADNSSYEAACLVQVGDTVTYDTATMTVTATTAGNYLGDVNITGGNMYIECAKDAIQAGEDILINNPTAAKTSSSGIGSGAYNLYVVSAGGYKASFDSTLGSYKAIKADDTVTIDDVKFYASTPEDTVSCDQSITVNGGLLTIYSGRDGIAAAGALDISGGTFNITTGGGYSTTTSSTDTNSYKTIKGTGSISISGGEFALNSQDDAVHSNGACTVSGGTFGIYTGDDAFHSDTTMTISGGDITVSSSYEGVEGLNVDISGGIVRVTASDDGVNAAGGADGSGSNTPTRPGPGGMGGSSSSNTSQYSLTLSGDAFLWVKCSGDGLDSNGSLTVNGGTVIVQQSGGGNSGFDADGTRLINGGLVIVLDGGDMVELPSTSSGQYCFSYKMSSSVAANSLVCVKDSYGNALFVLKAASSFKHMLISTPELASGSSYSVYTGGSCTGTYTDGLYSGGTYSGGTLKKTVTISSKVTSVS